MYYSLFITWRVRKKLELLEAQPRATFTLLSCSLNFPRASLTRYTTYIFVNFQFTKFSFIDFVLTDSRNLSGKRPIRPLANLPVVDFPQTHSNKLCLSLQKGIFLNKVRILVTKKKKSYKKNVFLNRKRSYMPEKIDYNYFVKHFCFRISFFLCSRSLVKVKGSYTEQKAKTTCSGSQASLLS